MNSEKTYKEAKGEEGENIVFAALEKALEQMDYSCPSPIRNAILPFKSVYGENGYIYAEFDIILALNEIEVEKIESKKDWGEETVNNMFLDEILRL